MGWYIVITEEMRAAGLTGNGLLLYALIHGYSQGEQGCYYGSLAHTAAAIGCTAETARTILKAFTEAGLVERFEFMDNGIHRVAYRTTQKIWDTQKILADHPKNLGSTTQKIWDNNKGDNKSIVKDMGGYNAPARGFSAPSLEDVRAYCEERRNGIDPQQFVDYYTANGWMVGKSKMKDWQAAVRNWETRRRNDPAPQAPRPEARRLSPEERTLAALQRLQSRDGNLHTFNPDEQ